ncbi:TPA_exp: hypothetical protein A8136_3197 [Trichophyton benhamiae CBS 112371]|nr:TPA_exp: hypothetical protein A8136_3197 [Trichophyton benhamiae CBS 112371]
MVETEAKQRARESIETFLKVYGEITKEKNYQGYDRRFFEDIRLIDADPSGGATWEMDVTEYWSNLNGIKVSVLPNIRNKKYNDTPGLNTTLGTKELLIAIE